MVTKKTDVVEESEFDIHNFKPELKKIKLSEVIFDDVIYPRADHDPALVQTYAENIESIEEQKHFIALSSDLKLLDGKHRWLAYRKIHGSGDCEISVYVYPVTAPHEELLIATALNSNHGWQLVPKDKQKTAKALYAYGVSQAQIAKSLSVGHGRINEWLSDILKAKKEEEDKIIFDMFMACYTYEEIAKVIGVTDQTIKNRLLGKDWEKDKDWKESLKNSRGNKLEKLLIMYNEPEWAPPIYNIWNFAKKTNVVSHFGNSEQGIVDNLVYTFTQPFDIVVDPFAGGGSTIDVCKKRLRRYYASDRKPIVERENEIRAFDIKDGIPPLNKNWSEVSLTYLDPPYWRQAQNKYSTDKEDLANMPLEQFTKTITKFVNDIMAKQSKGAVALIIQPTQWNADNHEYTDHVIDICNGVKNDKYKLFNRVSCPYSSEQCLPQMVNKAKEEKMWLVLTRELIVWKINK